MTDEDDIDLSNVDMETGEYVPGGLFTKPVQDKASIRYSISLIKDYQKCPAKAYARITRQPGSKSLALVNGIAVHGAMEMFLKEERDAVSEFHRQFDYEAEKNDIPAKGDDAEKKRAEGEKMAACGQELLSKPTGDGTPFNRTVDPSLVESFFNIEREGRLFVGKFDLIHFRNREEKRYAVIDFKTNKTVPNQFELDSDTQFSMYAWAAANDPKLPTYGTYPEQNTWLHLRGKNIAKDENGKTILKVKDKVWQYSFPTPRTEQSVEDDFKYTIMPVVEAIERGEWRRDKGEACAWCPYFDFVKKRCGAEIPKVK